MEFLDFTLYFPYIFIIIGIVSILVALFSSSKVKRLYEIGEQAEGIIFKLGPNDDIIYNKSEAIPSDKITVRFVTKKQEWITEYLNTDYLLTWTGQFKEGQKVTVLYDPNNPTDFTILTKQSLHLVKIFFTLVGLIFVLVGIYKLLAQA